MRNTPNVLKQYTPTELYSLVSSQPLVFARLLRLPYLVASLLHWRSTSRNLLNYLLVELEDSIDWVSIPHVQLCEGLWPELERESAKNKAARWLANFEQDQLLSGFMAIDRQRGRMRRTEIETEFLPTRYRVREFWAFAEIVGHQMASEGVLELKRSHERELGQRQIVARVLLDLGASPILPEMRDEEERRKKEGKEKDKFYRKVKRVKDGDEVLTMDELKLIESPSERLELAMANFLNFGRLFFDMVETVQNVEEASWLAEKAEMRFLKMKAKAMDRRYKVQRVENKKGVLV